MRGGKLLPPFAVAILVFVMWAFMTVFSWRRWLGYQWCMLITAIVIALAAGVEYNKAVANTIVSGALANASTIITFAWACVFARACIEAGIVESLVKKTIELGGGRPFITVALITAVWTILCPNIPGVAGVIVVGSITLPVMLAMGIKATTAARIHMLGTVISWPFWTVYWALYQSWIPGVYSGDYISMLLTISVVAAVFCYAWMIWRFKRDGLPIRWASKSEPPKSQASFVLPELAPREKLAPWYSYIAVLLPVFLVVFLKTDPMLAFIAALIPVLILSHPGSGRKLRDYFTLIERITYEGIKDVAPIAVNLIAVGWLTTASKYPEVVNAWKLSFGQLVPSGFSIAAVIVLILLLPTALFRGPGHGFGLGAMTLAALSAVGVPPLLLLGWLYAELLLMLFTCPTYANAVWAYSYVGEHPIRYLNKEDSPWGFIMAIAAFIVVIILFFPQMIA